MFFTITRNKPVSAADKFERDFAFAETRLAYYEYTYTEYIHKNAVHDFGRRKKFALVRRYIVYEYRRNFIRTE